MIGPTDILHGKILIVDDQEANVILLEQMLRGAGYDAITSTRDPERVCELHLTHRYDLILLDLLMPSMDGFQVMENLRTIETEGYLPVLVITAQPDHKLRALKAGARDFIAKPFDIAEVLLRVYNLLEVRMLHLETRRLCERLLSEQQVSQRLLIKGVTPSFAEHLRLASEAQTDGADPFPGLVTGSYAEVAVLFADILEFTKFAEGASAEVLRNVLDTISTHFEDLDGNPSIVSAINRAHVIGDAYLAAVGWNDAVTDHTIRASNMALDLVESVNRFNAHSRYKLKLSIGLDASGGSDLAAAREHRRTSFPSDRRTRVTNARR